MPPTPDLAALREALRLAHENVVRHGGGPFGAVVTRGGVVLAVGQNQVTRAHDPTAHAEVVAIRAACAKLGTHDLSGCEIHSSCEPCPMCLSAIHWARLDRLTFAGTRHDAAAAGFDDELLYRELALPPAARALPTAQALRGEAQAAFEAWRALPDKQAY